MIHIIFISFMQGNLTAAAAAAMFSLWKRLPAVIVNKTNVSSFYRWFIGVCYEYSIKGIVSGFSPWEKSVTFREMCGACAARGRPRAEMLYCKSRRFKETLSCFAAWWQSRSIMHELWHFRFRHLYLRSRDAPQALFMIVAKGVRVF